jgi:hypothetical protein
MAPSTSTPRQTYREVLSQAAAQARALLPPEVNGRIESAVKLVLQADVVFNSDGTATVGSASDPMKTYTLVGAACDCQDFTYGRAPGGFCQHKIAANLHKSVERVLARRAEPEPEVEPEVEMPADFEMYPDNDHEEVAMPPTPAPAPLPEAPASVNCHITVAGRQIQLTLRGMDELEVLARLERLLERYPVSTPPTNAAPEPERRFCPTHGTEMQSNSKEGRQWWSHRTADGWCKGQGGRS